jgi:hypothetical protein
LARFQLVDIGAHPGERVFASKERKWLPQQLRKSTAVCLITEARKAMQRIGKAAARNVYDWLTVGKAMVDAREEVFENPRHQSRRHPRLSPGVRYGPQARKAPR